MSFSPPTNQPIAQFGDVKVLEEQNLSRPNMPKAARQRREPKVFFIDGNPNNPNKFFDESATKKIPNMTLDQAISQGLVNPEHVNKKPKLEINPEDIKIDPAPFEKEKPVALKQDANATAEQLIAEAVAHAPQSTPVVQEPVVWEDPTDNMSPEDLLNALASAVAHERKCGQKLHLIDQNGNKILGLNIVRETPNFIQM